MSLVDVVNEAMEDMRLQSQKRLYRTDFQAWKSDILGFRTYEKMREIGDTALFGDINRTAIKSSNGTSKSFEVAAMIGWVSSVFEPGEAVSIVSAPSIPQIDKVIFAYLKANYGRAQAMGNKLPGWINESLEWKVSGPGGNIALAFGRKPSEQDAVSTFQGVRSQFGKTFVFFDEAGGMSKQMYTAAEAVLTGNQARLIAIGNPDNTGTEWQRIFTDKKYDGEYNRFTLSSFDLPTYTGEMVYPNDPEMQERMLSSLTQVSWVEHKKRIWGEHDARYLSKVLGEFPDNAGNGFFGQGTIDKATDTTIEPGQGQVVLGVDIARWGQDESVIYANDGGRVRLLDAWGKYDLVDSARRIHRNALKAGATEVRIDATGVGGGVFDMMDRFEEFYPRNYNLLGIDGASSSPDLAQWANRRAFNHDTLRTKMNDGEIDIDFDDEDLRDQLQIITYKFTNRGGIQITPKDDMKTEMGGSPDRLDALIYAVADLEWFTGNPINRLTAGDEVVVDPYDLVDAPTYGSAGHPM